MQTTPAMISISLLLGLTSIWVTLTDDSRRTAERPTLYAVAGDVKGNGPECHRCGSPLGREGSSPSSSVEQRAPGGGREAVV